jgi:hypothetical protein
MVRTTRTLLLSSLLLGPVLAGLGGCGQKDSNEAAITALDSRLTNTVQALPASADRTLNAAEETANAGAPYASPPRRASETGSADLPSTAATLTLGKLAAAQKTGQPTGNNAEPATAPASGSCASQFTGGLHWANRLPAALAVYPGAQVTEAAGVATARCNFRIVSLTTAASPNAVIDHYRAAVRASGYDAEVRNSPGECTLGGTRASDGAAYLVMVRRTGGRTEVDIVSRDGV